jgi:hypothetical protein
MRMPNVNSGALSVLYLDRNLLFWFKNGQKYTPSSTAFFGMKGAATRPVASLDGDFVRGLGALGEQTGRK